MIGSRIGSWLRSHQAVWTGVGRPARSGLTIRNARAASEGFIRGIEDYPGHAHGRGIVICAGGLRFFPGAWVCVRVLRKLGCALPVQFWHIGSVEIDEAMRGLARTLGVDCVDSSALRRLSPIRILKGWELKPYAMLHCPFREVMLIDADNIPVSNPERLFDCAEFRRSGALFWPDVNRLAASRRIWELCGVAYRDEPGFETGQIVLDKEKCWKALRLAVWYNERSDFYYRHVNGDAEMFHMAFRKLGAEFSMPRKGVHLLEHTYCQHDFEGRRLWQHRNGDKWRYSGEQRRVSDFWEEDACLEHLAELRSKWNGRIAGQTPAEASGDAAKKPAAPNGRSPSSTRAAEEALPVHNRGLAWVYYGVIRNLQPEWVVVLGSCQKLMPRCALRAIHDNKKGELVLVGCGLAADDPDNGGMECGGDSGSAWNSVSRRRVYEFPVAGAETLSKLRGVLRRVERGLAFIDGSMDAAQSLAAFDLCSSMMTEGLVVFHDGEENRPDLWSRNSGLRSRNLSMITVCGTAGVVIVGVGRHQDHTLVNGLLNSVMRALWV